MRFVCMVPSTAEELYDSFDKADSGRKNIFSPFWGSQIYESITVKHGRVEFNLLDEVNRHEKHGMPDLQLPIKKGTEAVARQVVQRMRMKWDNGEMPAMVDVELLFSLIDPMGCRK